MADHRCCLLVARSGSGIPSFTSLHIICKKLAEVYKCEQIYKASPQGSCYFFANIWTITRLVLCFLHFCHHYCHSIFLRR
jgi:hypothetical protein